MVTLSLHLPFIQATLKETPDLNWKAALSPKTNGELATQMAGSVMFVAPCIALYLFAQRYITEGVVTTGLKG